MASSRLAELLGGLSLACDIVSAFAPGKVLRTAVLSVELLRAAGEDPETQRDALFITLLRYLGCTGFAHEEGTLYGAGDDLAVRSVMALADTTEPVSTVSAIARGVAVGASLEQRVKAVGRLLFDTSAMVQHAKAQCDTSVRLAQIIGTSQRIQTSLRQICERWDGRGVPDRIDGAALSLALRAHQLSDVVEIAHHRSGRDAALELAKRRSERQLDPRLCRVFEREQSLMFAALEDPRLFDRFLACEPEPWALCDEKQIDDVARALAHYVDLKSSYFLGHSSGVAALCERTAKLSGFEPEELTHLRRAAMLHDVGRLTVPNGIWERPGRLGFGDWERVRLHGYYTERILSRTLTLSGAAAIAAQTHERLDGSGYHSGSSGSSLSRAARLLAVADAAHAMTEPRAHRPPRALDAIATELTHDARHGLLDSTSVDAVLTALGTRAAPPASAFAQPPTPKSAHGLSEREFEVLTLVARGKTNKEIGILLGISARTVQHHVAHIYDKIGVYSRAGAAIWVMEQGLLSS